MTDEKKPLIQLNNIIKSYQNGDQELNVLKGIDLTVYEGEFLAIMGPSGSGKSTLMNIIGLLDRPTSGDYSLNGKQVKELKEKELARVRNEEIGFVFQQFFLLSKLSALQNVELPLIYAGVGASKRRQLAKQFLEKNWNVISFDLNICPNKDVESYIVDIRNEKEIKQALQDVKEINVIISKIDKELKILEDKVNVENIDTVLEEFKDFCTNRDVGVFDENNLGFNVKQIYKILLNYYI